MKTIINYLLVFLFISACANPQKLYDSGDYQSALIKSQKRLKSGKIKEQHVQTFKQSFHAVIDQDAAEVIRLKAKNESDIWPVIYTKATEIEERQKEAKIIHDRLQENGFNLNLDWYPINELLEESSQKAAQYYYDLAMEYLPSARAGDRLNAREAHGILDQCKYYDFNFKDATSLQEELYDLGTTHLILRTNSGDIEENFAESLYEEILDDVYFPYRKDWQVIHLKTPESFPLHYQLEWVFKNPAVSFNSEDKDVCEIEKEVEDGYTEEEVWNEQDSVYVIERTPKFKTIEVAVTTFVQYKSANMDISQRLVDLSTKKTLDEANFNEDVEWSNTYSKTNGDLAALDGQCPVAGGSCAMYPSENTLLEMVAREMRYHLLRQLDDPVD